jgi:phosphoglycerate-specific signal transduction histidine kinase
MIEAEKILLALVEALEWQRRTMWGGTEHEQTVATQKVETMQKLAREVLDEITEQ